MTLRFEEQESVTYGWEPVLVGDEVIGHVAGGAYGHSVGAFLAHAFVDAVRAAPGTEVEVLLTGIGTLGRSWKVRCSSIRRPVEA